MAEYEKIRKETIDMVKKAEDEWWLSECEKLQNAGEKEKWKIISRLMNHTVVTDVWRIRKYDRGGYIYSSLMMKTFGVSWRVI